MKHLRVFVYDDGQIELTCKDFPPDQRMPLDGGLYFGPAEIGKGAVLAELTSYGADKTEAHTAINVALESTEPIIVGKI
jgi:hypothetical protein